MLKVSLKTLIAAALLLYTTNDAMASWFQYKSANSGNACAKYAPRQLRLTKELPPTDPCLDRGTSLVALSDIQVLFLCKDSVAQANYDLSLGRGGLDKKVDGDLKTPLGTYALGKPRDSDRFGIFIPVGYPTAQQKADGYTGGAIGVHGPTRMFRCAGFLNVSMNWTQGCLAVADDSFITEIANFVKANQVRTIHIVQ